MESKKEIQGFDISDKSACVIGVGGLGCNIAVHLTGAGIGRLYLCDFDKVSKSNLNRQFLYTEKDIGKSKCLTAAERLKEYSRETEIIAKDIKIISAGDMSGFADSDIIILAVDNGKARKAVQKFCEEKNIPLVCAGIDGFYGMTYLYLPNISPCPDCAGLNQNKKAAHNISSVAGIIGSLQANIAVRFLLTSDEDLAGKLTVFDDCRFDTLNVKPSAECSKCKK